MGWWRWLDWRGNVHKGILRWKRDGTMLGWSVSIVFERTLEVGMWGKGWM